jgi:SAM-dependent methyltransferase
VDLNPKYKPTVVADARNLPFRVSAFDGIHLSHILEHVIDPEKILKEVNRVVKTDRTVTIVFPNFSSLSVLMAWVMGFHSKRTGHEANGPRAISYGVRRAYNIVYGSHTVGEYDVHHIPLSLRLMYNLLRESGFSVESARGDIVRLPLRRFAVLRKASRALATIFPGKADVVTIVAKRVRNKRKEGVVGGASTILGYGRTSVPLRTTQILNRADEALSPKSVLVV